MICQSSQFKRTTFIFIHTTNIVWLRLPVNFTTKNIDLLDKCLWKWLPCVFLNNKYLEFLHIVRISHLCKIAKSMTTKVVSQVCNTVFQFITKMQISSTFKVFQPENEFWMDKNKNIHSKPPKLCYNNISDRNRMEVHNRWSDVCADQWSINN